MYSSSYFNLGPRSVWVVKATPRHFTPRKDKLLIVYEAGWAAGSVLTDAEYLVAARIRSSKSPVRSQSLHRLSYPDPIVPSTAT